MGFCALATWFVSQSLLWHLMAHVTSSPMLLLEGTLCPKPGGGKTQPRHRCWSSVRNPSSGCSGPVCDMRAAVCWQWQEPALQGSFESRLCWRGFETFPAFSVSFSKHGAILGSQSCLSQQALSAETSRCAFLWCIFNKLKVGRRQAWP